MITKRFFIAITLLCIWHTMADAQGLINKVMDNLYGGPKIEVNGSYFYKSDFDGTSKMNIGCAIGGFLGVKVSEHFAVQEDILIFYKTSKLCMDGNEEGDFRNIGAELTFYAMGNWAVGNGRILVGAGPFANYGLYAKYKGEGYSINMYKEQATADPPLKRITGGLAATAGYEFSNGIQLTLTYRHSIFNALDDASDFSALYPASLSLGVAYKL